METPYTVSTYLIQKLHECGVKHIFGVPGDYVLGFYDQLIRTKTLEVINTCDELAAAFAADAYARVKGSMSKYIRLRRYSLSPNENIGKRDLNP